MPQPRPNGPVASSSRGQCAAAPDRSETLPGFSQVASNDGSTQSTVAHTGGSSQLSTRPTSSASRAPLVSDVHRLLYAAGVAHGSHIAHVESPPSHSKAVQEWRQGLHARQLAAIRPLTEASVVSSYFKEELRCLLSTRGAAGFASWTSTPREGSAATSPKAMATQEEGHGQPGGNQPGGNPGANRWFIQSTPIQMPPESGGICG